MAKRWPHVGGTEAPGRRSEVGHGPGAVRRVVEGVHLGRGSGRWNADPRGRHGVRATGPGPGEGAVHRGPQADPRGGRRGVPHPPAHGRDPGSRDVLEHQGAAPASLPGHPRPVADDDPGGDRAAAHPRPAGQRRRVRRVQPAGEAARQLRGAGRPAPDGGRCPVAAAERGARPHEPSGDRRRRRPRHPAERPDRGPGVTNGFGPRTGSGVAPKRTGPPGADEGGAGAAGRPRRLRRGA